MADEAADVDLSVGDLEKTQRFINSEIKRGTHSTTFVDGLLKDIRTSNEDSRDHPYQLETDEQIDRYARDLTGRTHIPTRLIDFFRESINDGIDNRVLPPEFVKLRKLRDTSKDIAAQTDVQPDDGLDVEKYIDTQYKYWEKRAKVPSSEEEQQLARENQGVFRAFQMFLENPEGFDKTPEKIKDKQPELPEYEFHPGASDEFLTQQDVEKVDFKSLETYLDRGRANLYAQAETFTEQNPGAVEAVKSAIDYYDGHRDATEDIIAIIEDGKVVYTGNQQSAPKTEGQTFKFNPTEPITKPHSLGRYARRLYAYEDRIGDLDRGLKVLRRIMESDTEMITDGDDELAIRRILDLHKEYLPYVGDDDDEDDYDLPTEEVAKIKEQRKILNKYSELVEARTER